MADETSSSNQVKPAAAAKPAAKPAAAAAQPAPKDATAAGIGAGETKVGVRKEMEEREEMGGFTMWMQGALTTTPSWLVSMVFHLIVLLVLGLCHMKGGLDEDQRLVSAPPKEEVLDELDDLEEDLLEEIDLNEEVIALEPEVEPEEPDVPFDEDEAAAISVVLDDMGLEHAPRNDLLAAVGAYTGTGLSGRGSGKGGLVRKYGGNAASEAAVAAALKWLAAHQWPDGGWSFDLKMTPSCQGKCGNSGSETTARNGATAMALLPFLGAGQTHKEGKYKETVQRGLYFLVNRMKVSPKGGDLHEKGGTMYSHGLASIVLCEAFAMTKDKYLQRPAQASLNFICYAQDPVGGGWRYGAQQAGDTSVVGWQIMALKSGHMGYLKVPPVVVQKAFRYLDAMAFDSGSKYGYTHPDPKRESKATSAIGLLCRMYLGWKKDNPALERGVQAISKQGPNNDMYYNYYATQVCRHWEGDVWKKWNGVMRDQLVNSQVKGDSHETGSWNPGGGHGAGRGGRLYETSMCTMTLEVYYRHLPIFRGQAVEE
ncbi:MAG: terpene cyclase/mutase family protein, partial [Candidatus Nealsonbacteria bacterium]|nr:terpene cyclase/mutase family protein [Candidatus Nealsonbacteria bacterium]